MSKCYAGYEIQKSGPCKKCGAERNEPCGHAHIKDADEIESLKTRLEKCDIYAAEGWLIGDKFVPLVVMAILREGRFIGLSADKKLAVPTKAGRMCAFLAGHLKAYGDLPQ